VILPLTTVYVVLIRKHGSENVTQNSFRGFIIIINAGKLNCKNDSITDLVFQEHTSQIQDFFGTSVQFQDFSGPVGTLVVAMAKPQKPLDILQAKCPF